MESSVVEVAFGLEYEILIAYPPLRAPDGHKREVDFDPKVHSYDWMDLKRQCLSHLEGELGRLIDEELKQGEASTNLEELRKYQKNVKFISPERMENINAAQLAIATSLRNKGLPACYAIGNPLDGHIGQPSDLYHFLSEPGQVDPSIPRWANCFCVTTDSTVLPKPGDVYDRGEFEWAPIEVATPVFRGDVSRAGSSEIERLCATLQGDFLSWTNRSCDLHVHMSPAAGVLDLQTARRLVAVVWLLEPTLYTLAELNQDRRGNFQHKPVTIHSMIARGDGYDGPAADVAEAERLLPDALHGFLRERRRDDIYRAYQLARVCDAPDIPGLRRMIVGTNGQRLAITFREFEPEPEGHHHREGQRDSWRSTTAEFRFFTPTRDAAYSRMCIRVAAAIFAVATEPDPDRYRRKLGEVVRRLDRKPDRWRELLDMLGLGAEVAAWESVPKQHCFDPRKPCS